MITELARFRHQPVVICLDQVENLEDDHVRNSLPVPSCSTDACRNLLVVVSGVKSKLLGWFDSRLITQALGIACMTIPNSNFIVFQKQMVEDRDAEASRLLSSFPDGPAGLDPRPWIGHELFPLGQRWWAERTAGLSEMRPRDVVNWSRDQWIHDKICSKS